MNKPSGQYAANDTKRADPTRPSGPDNRAPTFTKVERLQDPKEPAQEAVDPVPPTDASPQEKPS